MTTVAAPSPTPKPSVNVDLSKVTAEDIRKTEEHRNALLAQQKSELEAEKADHLKVGTALAAATTANLDLQKKVDALNEHANKLQGSLDAANKKLWWYRLHWWGAWVMLGLGVAACLVFAFLKATGRLAVVASKVPGL
jgi:uncharacterized NAD(P)/FAD-binding protein YdhS